MSTKIPSASLPPPSEMVAHTLHSCLPALGEVVDIFPLAGDASNRRYFRIVLTGGSVDSIILMQLADPEGFKASEEAVSPGAPVSTELPFVNVLTYLQQVGVAVPQLYFFDEDKGLLYLEDFGDVTLYYKISSINSQPQRSQLYVQAIDALTTMHLSTQTGSDSHCLAFSRVFDVSLLMWEFEHFWEYGVAARQPDGLKEEHHQVYQAECHKIAEWLAAQPQVFTHRDYHSRNLMVIEGGLGILDFQDALLGPATYDLASLLRDSYVELEDPVIDEMLDRYRTRMCEGLNREIQEHMGLSDSTMFRKLFDFTSLQRNLKAAGRFVYIDRVKGNPAFLKDIPRTLGYVRTNLEKYSELAALHSVFASCVPEFQ